MKDNPSKASSTIRLDVEIFYLSFILLFLELILICWIGSEIRIFAYLKNYILIAYFLGIGVGCFQPKLEFKPFCQLSNIKRQSLAWL